MTLQQIKDAYAKENWPDNWEGMSKALNFPALDEIATRYARECCKATLEKAADNALIDYDYSHYETIHFIDKSSIDDPDNIVIL